MGLLFVFGWSNLRSCLSDRISRINKAASFTLRLPRTVKTVQLFCYFFLINVQSGFIMQSILIKSLRKKNPNETQQKKSAKQSAFVANNVRTFLEYFRSLEKSFFFDCSTAQIQCSIAMFCFFVRSFFLVLTVNSIFKPRRLAINARRNRTWNIVSSDRC